jgi:hypothetical protein
VRDRHPSAAGLGRFCRWGEELPLADREADDLDAALEVVPLACDFATTL